MKNNNTKNESYYVLLVISVALLFLSLANWDVFWVPFFITAIASIILLVLSIWVQIKLVAYYTLAILSVGGIVASSAAEYSPPVLTASIILFGVTVACIIATSQFSKHFGVGETSDSAELGALLEAAQMSENAKRVLFRGRELCFLRDAVQEDIEKGEFHSALVLCDQMANVFGAVEESEQMRTQVQQIIHRHHEDRIRNEMEQLETLLSEHKWVEAYQYAARLRRLFPESPLLQGLEQHIADARTEYGRNLEVSFLQAADNEDIDNAMGLLRELDSYLTPEDARKFKDVASTVVSTYRESLGAKFKMAVNDHRWREAIVFGEELTRHFPNTKMAEEAKEMLETIHVRLVEEDTSV